MSLEIDIFVSNKLQFQSIVNAVLRRQWKTCLHLAESLKKYSQNSQDAVFLFLNDFKDV